MVIIQSQRCTYVANNLKKDGAKIFLSVTYSKLHTSTNSGYTNYCTLCFFILCNIEGFENGM